MPSEYAKSLGARLRSIRQQQGLSLQGVEEKSTALEGRRRRLYERGDRAVTVPAWPSWPSSTGYRSPSCCPTAWFRHEPTSKIVLDLERLYDEADEDLAYVARYARAIQQQRGDYNGRVLSIRADDLRALAIVYDVSPSGLIERLNEHGVLVADPRALFPVLTSLLTTWSSVTTGANLDVWPRNRAASGTAAPLGATSPESFLIWNASARGVVGDPAEQAVEEARRVVGGQLSGQLHRLADRHRVVDLVDVQQLVHGDPGQVAVDHRHPVQRPALGVAWRSARRCGRGARRPPRPGSSRTAGAPAAAPPSGRCSGEHRPSGRSRRSAS